MSISGDERLSQIFDAHEPFVRALAIKYAPTPSLSDDIVQQVFLEFLAKYDTWDTQSDLRPLLHTMTHIVARRCWHERSRTLSPEMRQLAEHIRQLAEARGTTAYDEQQKEALRACLQKLPEKSRKIIEAHYVLGVPSKDIASRMQLSADSIRQAMCRLRAQLKKCMESSLTGESHA